MKDKKAGMGIQEESLSLCPHHVCMKLSNEPKEAGAYSQSCEGEEGGAEKGLLKKHAVELLKHVVHIWCLG